MKNVIKVLLFIVIIGNASSTSAQDQTITGLVKLRGTRLTYPLVRKWITEFNKEYPNVVVLIAPSAPADSIDFTIASYALTEKELDGRQAVIVTRYVQLPIVNARRPGLHEWQVKGISEKNFNELFFPTSQTLVAWTSVKPVVYIRDRPTCAVKAFATHYGKDPAKITGTGIRGDDEDLADAVKKDVNGIAFNNLGFIYDVSTRQIRDSLAIIPLDLNENGIVDKEEDIYHSLDDVIGFIERTHHPKFVNERVNFIFRKTPSSTAAGTFMIWVLTKGQSFNHELGFLNLDAEFLSRQREVVASLFVR